MWTRLAAGISDRQRKQLVEDAAKALQNLPLDELRDSNRLALKAQQQLARLISGMAVAVPAEEIHILVHQVVARLGGLGFFHDLLPPQRSDLSEIAVTPDGTVWILKKGAPRFKSLPIRPPRGEVWRGVEALLAPLGRAVNEATPSVDAKLPRGKEFSGARIKVLHPCIVPGEGFPSVNIRLYEAKPVTPEQLIAWEMAPGAVIRSLVETVGRGARLLIVGGTATGKTTFLSGISAGIPRAERVVKIEDPEEIWIDHPHVVTIEARPAPPGSSIPPYTVRNGVDDAMRMSPRWLIVGEVRTGDAAMSLFRAQMSDHPGLSTFHAEGPEETVFRLSVIMFADLQVQMPAARSIFCQAVDAVVQVGWAEGRRVLIGVWEVGREMQKGEVVFRRLYARGDPEMQPLERR
jgi:pilus assembly protein CpaF